MNGYILHFLVYTMGMVGIMFLALVIYKKSMSLKRLGNSKNNLKIEESLPLSPKKTLYVIQVKDEKFLIASDMDRTSFLAKLEGGTKNEEEPVLKMSRSADLSEMKKPAAFKNKNTPIQQEAQGIIKRLADSMTVKRG